jgi:hypothetical protein
MMGLIRDLPQIFIYRDNKIILLASISEGYRLRFGAGTPHKAETGPQPLF